MSETESKAKKLRLDKRLLIAVVSAFFIGVIWFIGMRMLFYKNESVHYHANFALYINSEKDEFDGPGYYEEVSACSDDHHNQPESRSHMHGDKNSNYVVHVHDEAVTWGSFLNNLGYSVGDEILETGNSVHVEDDKKKLTFILNGEEIESVYNKVIGDEDVLLVSYGTHDEKELLHQYNSIKKDAGEYNAKQDPAACSGDDEPTFRRRLESALGI
jgi:hypothetical protein